MLPLKNKNFILYRIYYDNVIVYLGRTTQPLQDRIRGHLFKKPMHRVIDIEQVSRIEYTVFNSQADMYLYEIYFINLFKPALNCDDKARDALSVTLPEVEWKIYYPPLWEKWRKEIADSDREIEKKAQKKREFKEKVREMRAKRRAGEITEDEYWDFYESEIQNL